jgi:formate dehydrogenase major subunit
MTLRTPNATLRPTDYLDLSPDDARTLGLSEGERVRVRSRYGATVLPIRISGALSSGELFATFHTPDVFLNRITGPARDGYVGTPEYKITAARIEKLGEP